MEIVKTEEVSKFYDKVRAVENLNLKIEEGEIYGLLGPNGAGKTTTILMLLGLTEPTTGKIQVYGYNPTTQPLQVKKITGYLPENVGFYEDLTARENLRYVARLNGISDKKSSEKITEVLSMVGLLDVGDWEVGKFSRGMKQRLGIASVLIKDPKFVILDEPTTGIDPEGAARILELIVKMREEKGITVLLCSHLLHQVQRICDRVGIFSKGHLAVEGSVDKLGEMVAGKSGFFLEVELAEGKEDLAEKINNLEGVREVTRRGKFLSIRCDQDVREKICRIIVENGDIPLQMKGRDYTLEEIYVRYFQEGG